MGSGRIDSMIPDLFSMASPREEASLSPEASAVTVKPSSITSRHVLPNELPAAIRHLDDHELEQLLTAVTAEQQRRGKVSPALEKIVSKRADPAIVSLMPGKVNAVRAAFKAGVKPARIAREFGIPQADVRKVIAAEATKKAPSGG